jgi:hypothetical protein
LSKGEARNLAEITRVGVAVIDAADNDALDLMRSRPVKQEVLDQLDEPTSRELQEFMLADRRK